MAIKTIEENLAILKKRGEIKEKGETGKKKFSLNL